jgi:hypothetical protein
MPSVASIQRIRLNGSVFSIEDAISDDGRLARVYTRGSLFTRLACTFG